MNWQASVITDSLYRYKRFSGRRTVICDHPEDVDQPLSESQFWSLTVCRYFHELEGYSRQIQNDRRGQCADQRWLRTALARTTPTAADGDNQYARQSLPQ